MRPDMAPVVSAQTTMKEYRKEYRKKQKEFMSPANMAQLRKEEPPEIIDFIVRPRAVDMTQLKGTEEEMWHDIEYLYANDGWAFDPEITYPPAMIDNYGKDYALNARGIYYFKTFRPELVIVGRKVWVPSFQDSDWEDPGERKRRKKARIIVKHNLDNETIHKSEYAWEADAWRDVFDQMRDDPCLELDKHQYFTEMAKTHPVLCSLTGETAVINRIPDATFGLATFSDSNSDSPVGTSELNKELLEKLLLYPKCGLLCDPKWGETDLVFPFAVYEAKGWSGDCRVARRQACQAGARYLDMLDNLARTPGPVNSLKRYQTETSHQYQVFALTSFGAHWHLLVGYRRPRQVEEHAGTKGMSETVYIFQKVWSAHVTTKRAAWELLSLVNQIHLWAITEFRTFVTEHLRSWHKFCDDNYLLNWKSVYDRKPELKEMRTSNDSMDSLLPYWAKLLEDSIQRKVYARALKSLAKALKKHHLRKGKGRCKTELQWQCWRDQCPTPKKLFKPKEFLNHFGDVHHCSENEFTQIKQCLDRSDDSGDEEGQLEEMDGVRMPVALLVNKRRFIEEESLNGGPSESSSEFTPCQYKRVRVA